MNPHIPFYYVITTKHTLRQCKIDGQNVPCLSAVVGLLHPCMHHRSAMFSREGGKLASKLVCCTCRRVVLRLWRRSRATKIRQPDIYILHCAGAPTDNSWWRFSNFFLVLFQNISKKLYKRGFFSEANSFDHANHPGTVKPNCRATRTLWHMDRS